VPVGLGRVHCDTQHVAAASFQLKRRSKCRKVTEIVPGNNHAAGVGLADDLPNSITLVAAHGWAQFPDQFAE